MATTKEWHTATFALQKHSKCKNLHRYCIFCMDSKWKVKKIKEKKKEKKEKRRRKTNSVALCRHFDISKCKRVRCQCMQWLSIHRNVAAPEREKCNGFGLGGRTKKMLIGRRIEGRYFKPRNIPCHREQCVCVCQSRFPFDFNIHYYIVIAFHSDAAGKKYRNNVGKFKFIQTEVNG